MRSPEAAPLVGFGATPQLFRVKTYSKEEVNKGAGSEASLPVTKKALQYSSICMGGDRRRSPEGDRKALWKHGNDQYGSADKSECLKKQHIIASRGFRLCGGESGGFAVAPDTPSQCTPMFLGLYRCRGFRACGRESGALRSPPTPLRSAHPCSLTVIAGWENRNCPPSAPQSFPHADAPDSQTAPSAPGTAARRPSARQTG